jgi:hypothetical protein
MRSLAPLARVMVPPPAQEPDRAWNGVFEACTAAGSDTKARAAAPAANTRFLNDVLDENMATLPLDLVLLIRSRNNLQNGSLHLGKNG